MRAKPKSRLLTTGLTLFLTMVLLAAWGCVPTGPTGPDPDYDTFKAGPYRTTQDLRSGPSGDSGLFHPTGTGTDNQKFPIFLWGCGAASGPRDYTDHMNRIASHGFVVVAEVSSNSGTELTRALDWLISENDNPRSPLYQKLDISGESGGDNGNGGSGCDTVSPPTTGGTLAVNVAAGGHSRGSIGTFAIADDPRLKTTIHVAGGSFDGRGSRSLRNPTIYIAGENDSMATSNVERDYRATTVPVFMTVMSGVDHMQAAREGLPAIIAWLRWHLMDETERQADFFDRNGVFNTGKWDSKYKNW